MMTCLLDFIERGQRTPLWSVANLFSMLTISLVYICIYTNEDEIRFSNMALIWVFNSIFFFRTFFPLRAHIWRNMSTIVTALTLVVDGYPLPDIKHFHCCFLQLYYGSEDSCILFALLVINDYPLPDIKHFHCCFLQLYYGSEDSCILFADCPGCSL